VAIDELGPPAGWVMQESLAIPSGDDVRQRWQECCRELRVVQREYAINRAFDRGDHYLSWSSDLTDAVIRDFRTTDEERARTTVNLMRARRRSLTARLTASELAFNVRASSPDDRGMRRQRLNTQILESLRTSQQWEALRAKEVRYAMFGGVAAICWDWDPTWRNMPVVHDPQTGTLLPAPSVRLSALSIVEFGLEPGSPTQTDANWWIRVTGAPPKQVRNTYRLEWEPTPDAHTRSTPMARLLAGRRNDSPVAPNLCNVFVYYRRPTAFEPGCVVHYVNGKVVAAGPWPFPHEDRLNLYVFTCDDPDETWITDPWLSDARSPQMMYNDVRTTIREHAQRAANARIIAEEGSLDGEDVFSDAVAEVVFHQQGTPPPQWMKAPEVARWLVGEAERCANEINDLLSQPEIARGVAPGDRNSGTALALLAEKADGPLGPFARDQARGWGVVATNVLRTLRHHMVDGEQRQTVTHTSAGSPQPQVWTRDDIDADVEVLVPVETTEPRSFAAVRAQMIDLARTFPAMFESIDPSNFARMLGLSSVTSMLETMTGSTLTTWENERLFQGIVVVPDEWNDHGFHIAAHERERNSPTYELADPNIQRLIDAHIDAHKALAAEAMAKAMAQQAQLAAAKPPAISEAPGTEAPGQKDEPEDE
jgi:hypothetical protein